MKPSLLIPLLFSSLFCAWLACKQRTFERRQIEQPPPHEALLVSSSSSLFCAWIACKQRTFERRQIEKVPPHETLLASFSSLFCAWIACEQRTFERRQIEQVPPHCGQHFGLFLPNGSELLGHRVRGGLAFV